jgi:uncharacterized protein YbbK (DUF523 family)
VSACLLGVRCRYDGESRRDEDVIARCARDKRAFIIPVCPEQLGGLPTPRARCEVVRSSGGEVGSTTLSPPRGTASGEDVLEGRARVVGEDGEDRTEQFLRGAEEALRLARLYGARRAILKTNSPSCDPVAGVAAAVLRREGIQIESAG